LYLIPNVISEGTQFEVIPPHVIKALKSISHFLVEDVRTARRYLSSLKIYDSIDRLHFEVLNKDTKEIDLADMMKPLLSGNYMGIISESGCPGVADPGAKAVAFAHQRNIQVIPLVGPSSILLGLMASGLNGQKFAFHGYLPIDGKEAIKTIKDLERESKQKQQTQIFIETPFRNNQVFDHFLNSLDQDTLLTIAIDIAGDKENIRTKSVRDWKAFKPVLPKAPSIFLFGQTI
jgi:16S rRNA (cytidine1402-2'-O)-methyltransferase